MNRCRLMRVHCAVEAMQWPGPRLLPFSACALRFSPQACICPVYALYAPCVCAVYPLSMRCPDALLLLPCCCCYLPTDGVMQRVLTVTKRCPRVPADEP